MNIIYDTPLAESQGVTTALHARILAGFKTLLPSAGPGTIGGLISTICCLVPAVAIAVGLTGGVAATLVSLGRFRPYGIVFGLAFVIFASWFSLRRSRTCCTVKEYRRRQIAVPLTMLACFAAVYVLIMYVILPLLYKANL